MKCSLSTILYGILCLAVPAFAMEQAEYDASLVRLRSAKGKVQEQMARRGIPVARSLWNLDKEANSESSSSANLNDDDYGPRKPLFTLHSTEKALQAEPGKLLFGIVSHRLIVGGETSPAIVLLRNDQGPFSGLKILGTARPSGTEKRLAIDCDRLIGRSGKSIPLKGVALDDSGALGLEAQVFSSKAISVAGAMAGSFVSGLAASQQTQAPTAFGFSQVNPTGRNSILQGIAQTAADQAKHLLDESTQERPVLVVENDTAVTVFLEDEVRF